MFEAETSHAITLGEKKFDAWQKSSLTEEQLDEKWATLAPLELMLLVACNASHRCAAFLRTLTFLTPEVLLEHGQ